MQDKTIRWVAIFFSLIAAVLIFVAVQAVRNIGRSIASSDWVNHSHAVIVETEAVRSALLAGDGVMHTFVLTGDARDLQACREALSGLMEDLDIAKALTRFEPAQNGQFVEIEAMVKLRSAFTQKILVARQSSDMATVRLLLAGDADGATIREIQRKIDRVVSDEQALLTERDRASYLQAQTTRWTVWTGVVVDVLFLAGAAWLIRDDLATRRRAAASLNEANEKLEARVQERTAELGKANAQLSADNLERQWANQALEHQLRYNHLIVDSINDLVLVLTKALNISRVNPAVVHLTGLEPAELINQPLSRIVRLVAAQEGADAPLVDPIAQALKDGRDLREQAAVVVNKRGQKTRVRFSIFPLRDQDKVVGGVVTLQALSPLTEITAQDLH